MTNPLPYLVRMLVFLAAVCGLAWYLHEDLLRVFKNTPDLDAVILAVLVIGIFFIFRQVILLWPEVRWLRRFRHRDESTPPPSADSVNLLAPLAAMVGERQDFRLSPTATRALLDGIAVRLDERRELARYMIGLLIFLGLLGTFWGLLQTIGAVADAINGLQVAAGDAVSMFAKLKASIEGPLKGMSTAFGASLFGLSGSLVLGFLELQASQAQGRFHSELEEWLAGATSLSTAATLPVETGGGSMPAYVEALLERSAEGMDGLARSLQRIEESRQSAAGANASLVERLGALAETMRTQQNLLARFTELSIEMRSAVNRLGDRSGAEADREAMAAHQRNLEAQINRLIEEEIRSRVSLADELRGGFNRLSDRSADEADREAILAKQRDVESQLARLVEENARSNTQVVDGVRGVVEQLASRPAAEDRPDDSERQAEAARQAAFETQRQAALEAKRDADLAAEREAAAARQRETDAQLAKLADEQAQSRAALIAELRNMAARVADRTAAEADRDSLLAEQRAIGQQVERLGEVLQDATQRLGEAPADTGVHQALIDQQRTVETQMERLGEELRGISGRLAEQAPAGNNAGNEALVAQQRSLETRINSLGDELRSAIRQLAERPASDGDRESLQLHQRNVEAFLTRLSEENARARTQLAEELSNAVARMPDRAMAEADRESLASHQRNIEGHLARLVEENVRNRGALVDELRESIGRLSERFAENDRDAVAAHQRNIEGHLSRLAEEATQSRSSLVEELRGEIRLLARTIALSRKEG